MTPSDKAASRQAAKALCALLALGATLALAGCGMPASCERPSDCPQATVCALGVCRLECPCGDGERCIDGACYTPQCDSGVTCAAGSVCVGETCGNPQCGGQDCGSKHCDPKTQQCVECLGDAQCPWTSFRCDATTGSCVCAQTQATEESCADNLDNDCDRTSDCADTSCDGRACGGGGACRKGACCQAKTTRELSCSDGIDDDCDGKTDCEDDNCLDELCLAEGACTNAARCLATGACAAPTNKPATTQCRAAGSDVCDPAEFCTGTSPECPPDRVAAAGLLCRGRQSGQLCDAVEKCDGTSPTCPADRPEPAGTLCRGAEPGSCDHEDFCDGTSPSCADRLQPRDTVCKAATNPCDPADTCTGTSASCPANYAPVGAACSVDTNRCTADQCNGSGACVAPNVPDEAACPGGSAGTVCCGGQDACIDLSTDSENCGSCGVRCSGTKECIAGSCCEVCGDGSTWRCGAASC